MIENEYFHNKNDAILDVVFENCESIKIPFSDIIYFNAKNIVYDIYLLSNALVSRAISKFIQLSIVNKPEYKRLIDYRDITSMTVLTKKKNKYEDSIEVHCPYKDKKGNTNNIFQKTKLYKNEIRIEIKDK